MTRSLALAAVLLAPAAAGQTDGFTRTVTTSQVELHDVRAVAMGDAGAFLPDASPLSFVQNPARLAEAAVAPMLRVAGHTYTRYFGIDGTTIRHLAATGTVGSVAVGAAVSSSYDETLLAAEAGEAVGPVKLGDTSALLGGAVRLGSGRVRVDLGGAARVTRISTALGLQTSEARTETQMRPALDLGAIVTVDLIPSGLRLADGQFVPTASASAGYTQGGIGPKYSLGIDTDGDPRQLRQSRGASLGVAVQLGMDAAVAGGSIPIADLDLAAEARTLLNGIDCQPPTSGQSGLECTQDNALLLGDVDLAALLFGTSDNEDVVSQVGVRLTLAETIWIASGDQKLGVQAANLSSATWGAGLSLGGALRTFGALRGNERIVALGRRFDLNVGMARVADLNPRRDEPAFVLVTVGGAVRL